MDTLAFDDDDDTFRVDNSDVWGTTNYDPREWGGVSFCTVYTYTSGDEVPFLKRRCAQVDRIDRLARSSCCSSRFFFNRAFHEKTKKNAREDESITREG